MRKLLFILVSVILLAACGYDNKTVSDNEEKLPTQVETTEDNEMKEETENNKEAKEESSEGELLEVGQVRYDSSVKASVELMAINEINETIDLDPMKLTIKSIKIVKYSEVEEELALNEVENILGERRDPFYAIQMIYNMENTVENNVEFSMPIKYVVLNTGEQIEVMNNDLAWDKNNGGVFYGKVKKESFFIALIESSKVEDISSIKIVTGNLWDENDDLISSEVEKTYELQ